ncbi:MAG: response regulator transcription factor [Candidatus Marinimicrobia bacterium]|nr:response regulator transcription factor [Candidatus Neomarinimicrobiota bacterium]
MSSRGKILILWNDTKTVQSIQDQLAGDFEIILDQDVGNGYEQALHFQPDCILADIPLDNLAGINMLKKIRNTSGLESAGLLLLTDRNENRYASPIEGLDVDLCIAKPYLIEELTAALIGMIQVHRRCQKLLTTE